MKIFACGEAQSVSSPGTFLDERSFCRVVGVTDLGTNNSQNSYGWCGVKAVVHLDGKNYILDFPEEVRIETDDGLAFLHAGAGDLNSWHPSLDDCKNYGLYMFDLKS